MNIGILGGTFSPPHLGHAWLAQQVLEDEEIVYNNEDRSKLDKIWIVPNNGSDHYGKKTAVSSEERLIMCQFMVTDFGNPNIEVSDIEIKNKITYTYQLAEYLEKEYHNDKFHLIIGGDWEITKFRNWERITDIFGLIQVHRPGTNDVESDNEGNYMGSGIEPYQDIEFDLSSSVIRERVSKGLTIRGLVTPSVEKFIEVQKLYKEIDS